MNDKPTDQKTYTEAEVQEMLRRSGINKKLVAVTIIGVYDNGENVVQSAYHEHGLRVIIDEIQEVTSNGPIPNEGAPEESDSAT